MKKNRNGFTLVEVSLFLAITAVIFVGIVAGTQNSVFQQRYNDAVQSFVDFLKNNYSQVMNVQSDGNGRSNNIIYGRMIVFGGDDDNYAVTSYSVIGGENELDLDGEGGALNWLRGAMVGVTKSDGGGSNQDAGLVETYKPKWGSAIQIRKDDDGFELFEGAVVIVRHPETGSVYTYWTDESSIGKGHVFTEDAGEFYSSQLDLCVNPNGNTIESDLRRDVRIVENARNASGVVLVPDDDSGCK